MVRKDGSGAGFSSLRLPGTLEGFAPKRATLPNVYFALTLQIRDMITRYSSLKL